MYSLSDVERELELVTYKPGWYIDALPHPTAPAWVRFRMLWPNAYKALGGDRNFNLRYVVPPIETQLQFRNWLLSLIQNLELHESLEWFRDTTTDRPVFDPHDPLGLRPDTGNRGVDPY